MHTETRSLYKIWRKQTGRSLKRWLTEEQVAHYKAACPHWRWHKIPEINFTKQESLTQQAHSSYQKRQAQSNQSVYARPSNSYGYNWGRYTSELRDAKRHNPNREKISWDDILDVHLALKGGI